MTQIKLRAWDPEYNTMLDWQTLQALMDGEQYAYSGPMLVENIKPYAKTANGNTVYKSAEPTTEVVTQKVYKGNPFKMHGLIFMPYAGLTDKLGNDLYQGHIVKFKKSGKECTAEIVFKWGMFCLKWPDGYINKYHLQPENLEIIGNIYQNPELLKK